MGNGTSVGKNATTAPRPFEIEFRNSIKPYKQQEKWKTTPTDRATRPKATASMVRATHRNSRNSRSKATTHNSRHNSHSRDSRNKAITRSNMDSSMANSSMVSNSMANSVRACRQ